MDIEKLIKQLKKANANGSWNTLSDYAHKAADALQYMSEGADEINNALQEQIAKNVRLRKERDVAIKKYEAEKEDFIDYVCSGVPNLSPYCMNRCLDCVDERGWWRSEKCHGFSRERGIKED